LLLCLLAACEKSQEDVRNQANQYLKSAQQLAAQGQLRAALVQAKNVIQIAPDSAEGYLQIARIYNQIGYYSEVEKLLANKLALMPELIYPLAYSYYQRKKYRTALDTLALAGTEQNQDFRLLKSLCYLHLGETNEFDMEVKKISAFAKDDGYEIYARAKAAQMNRDWDVASQFMLQINSASKLYIDALTSLAEIYIEQSKFDDAEKKLTDALSITLNADTLTVEKARILTMLVQMLVQAGRSGDAYTYQRILATANPQLDSMKSRFDEAVELYSKGDVESARHILTSLHQSFPNNSNVTTLLGIIAFQSGNDEEAEAYLSDVIDPETATSGLIQASSLLKARNNRIDEAIELLKTSVNAQPKNPQLLATYGLTLLQKNPLDKDGVMALEKSVAMDPSQQRLRLAIAERHYRLNEKEQGLAQLETAYRNSPLDRIIVQTYFNQLASDIGSKAVVSEIDQLKQKYPQEHQVTLIESWWLIKQKQYDLAEKKLLANITHQSMKEKMDSWLMLSELYQLQGKKELAQKTIEDYLRVSPQTTALYPIWMGLLDSKTEKGMGFLRELQLVDESAWQPHFYLALLYAGVQEWDQVDQSLNFVLQKNPKENIQQQIIRLYNAHGFELYKSGDLSQSQKVFIKALGVKPDDRTALYYYVLIALKNGQIAEAKKILTLDQDKKLAIHFFLEGLINEAEGKNRDALSGFRTAWSKDSFDLYAEKLYSLYQASNDQKALAELVQEWHQRLPQNPKALLLYAMLRQQQGQEKEAIDTYEKLLKLQSDNVIAMNNLAWLYLDVDLARAEELASKANKLSPDAVEVVDTYAWILYKNGKASQALEIIQRAIELAPDNEALKEHLDVIQQSAVQ
jgi:cellulose synthase operon protein C